MGRRIRIPASNHKLIDHSPSPLVADVVTNNNTNSETLVVSFHFVAAHLGQKGLYEKYQASINQASWLNIIKKQMKRIVNKK